MSSPATGGSGQLPKPATTRRTSKSSSWSLCSAVSTTRAAICTPPATLAVGAISSVSAEGGTPARSATKSATSAGGALARLQAQHRGARVLVPVEVVVEVLGADQRAPRPAAHREVAVAVELPAGVLRGQAGERGVVGGDREPGQPAAVEDQRRVGDRSQPRHADLGEAAPRLEAARGVRAAVDDPRAVGQRGDRHAAAPRRRRPAGRRARSGAVVERERHRASSRIRISPRRSSRPSPHQRA